MLGVSHALSGAATGLATAPLTVPLHPPATAVWCGAVVFGSLLPDIDHRSSTVTRSAGWISRAAGWGVRSGIRHRGPTHYAVTALGLGAAIAVWHPWLGAAVALGMIVHDLGDLLTRSRFAFLWPARPFALGLFPTGGLIERALVTPAMLGLVMLAAWHVHRWPFGPG